MHGTRSGVDCSQENAGVSIWPDKSRADVDSLRSHLSMAPQNAHLVIAANRLPVHRVRVKGRDRWEPSPGGLVSALTPVVKNAGGAWVGWTGKAGPAPRSFVCDDITIIPIPLTRTELTRFYQGFCNATLWPLYHDAVREPEYHRRWWVSYTTVNERYAEVVAKTAARGGEVWIHDYHLQLVPELLREMRSDLRIGFFSHIPFPPQELFAQLPWRSRLLEGTLGADVIGFQTKGDAQNFLRCCQRYTDARVAHGCLEIAGRGVHIGVFPISIDFERYDSAAQSESVQEEVAKLHRQLGQGRRIILGVDRLDYTKGIDLRLRAFGELLARRGSIEECVLVQIAVPSRDRLREYKELRSRVEELVGLINGQYGEVGLTPIHYLRRELKFESLIAMYRSADIMLVTPRVDGMNLVAKEYVATRFDNTGVLVLSEFTGSAEELRAALTVNPHDVDGLAESLDRALSLPPLEQQRCMAEMRETIKNHTVYDWADRFMTVLSAQSAPSSANSFVSPRSKV